MNTVEIQKSTECLTEYRCQCGKLLFKGGNFLGLIEIKCKRCGEVKRFGNL